MRQLEVLVLGPAEIVSAARETLPVRQPLAQALAVRLALARGEAVADDILIRDLWADEDTARPAARLRVLASRLRNALGEHSAALRRTPAGFSLLADPADLSAAERALTTVDAVRRSGDQARVFSTSAAAIGLWRGEPLADLHGIPFVEAERRRLQTLQVDLQLAWAEAGLALGRAVGPELERMIAVHPLHERLVGLSALALARAGQQADALDRLRTLRSRLADELGIDPTPETVALEDDLRGHRPPAPRIPLPTAAKTFVGRDREQAALLRDLRQPSLITLLGGPGAGKTRLAREVAAHAAEQGRSVAWLDLGPLHQGDNVVAALAGAVGADGGGESLGHSAELLTGALLVVDNAEHLVDAVVPVIDALQLKAVELSILVTSQRALGMSDEKIRRIGPLPAADAAQLFCDRSGTEPGPAVEKICAAVDRLPLSIELAAGLTRTLSVEQLAARIDDRLRLLIRGFRDAGPRHSSLRAALDWSHELLEPPVRTVLRRMAVFAGGCALDAAEQVLAGDGIEIDEVAELLAVLVDRSLVTMDTDERFSLLETVREYGLEQLRAADEEAAVRNRHVRWCVELARFSRHAAALHQRFALRQQVTGRVLRLEEPNLIAAIDWCLAEGNDPARVGEIVAPLSWHWLFRGLMGQARAWLRASLAGLTEPTVERAAALAGLAAQTRFAGGYAEALETGLESATIYRSLGDRRGLAIASQGLTLTSLALDDVYAALQFGREAEVLTRELRMGVVLGAALNCNGMALRQLGYPVEARAYLVEAYDVWAELNDEQGKVLAMGSLGILDFQAGDLDQARARALEALRIARGIGYSTGVLDCFGLLAILAAAEGSFSFAVRLLAVCDRQREEIGAPVFIVDRLQAEATAWAQCRAALGPETDRIAALVRRQAPETLAAELLAL
ncbi:tetratricopeptide repeat protein [Kribbella sp. NBC_01505]|uniref:ATP-binding protein n=1 Tax=Kribbella sp. NBC_01505 TaxID=2903580 RepID=UPI00386BBAA3